MFKIISSYRSATVLIVILLLSVVAFAVPLPLDVGQFRPVWFMVIFGLLAASISYSTMKRVTRELKRRKIANTRPPTNGGSFTYRSTLSLGTTWCNVNRLLSIVNRNVKRNTTEIRGVRETGSIGVWGSIVFHLALMIIIAGIVLSVFFSLRIPIAITEGEPFQVEEPYKEADVGQFYDTRSDDSLVVSIQKFDPRYQFKNTFTPASWIIVRQNENHRTGLIHVNRKFTFSDFIIHQSGHWGYSVGLLLRDAEGKILFNGIIRLASPQTRNSNKHQDHIVLPGGEDLQVELLSDSRIDRKLSGSQRHTMTNPTIRVRLMNDKDTLFRTIVPYGRETSLDHWTLSFPDIRYWSQLDITYDPGLPILYLGFFLGVTGLAFRFLFIRRSIIVTISEYEGGSQVVLSGLSERFPTSFQPEVRRLFNSIRDDLVAAELRAISRDQLYSHEPQEVKNAVG